MKTLANSSSYLIIFTSLVLAIQKKVFNKEVVYMDILAGESCMEYGRAFFAKEKKITITDYYTPHFVSFCLSVC